MAKYQSDFYKAIKEALGERTIMRPDGDRFIVSSDILFPSGKYTLSADGKKQLAAIAGAIKDFENKIDPKVFDRLPIRRTFNNNYFDDPYQGIPIEGYTSLIESLLQGVKRILDVKVTSDFDFSSYDLIYNTGPIDEFMNYELGHLGYRSLYFDTKFYKDMTFQEYAVINEASKFVPYTRTIEHKHFNDMGQKDTVITFEYPKDSGEPYYPINNEINNTLYEKYIALAKEKFPNMIFCGRLGAYKYLDMDDAIKESLKIYKNVSK